MATTNRPRQRVSAAPAAKKTTKERKLFTVPPPAGANDQHPAQASNPISEPLTSDDVVTANVPQTTLLTLDRGMGEVIYQAGIQKMPRSHAEHWFCKARGVTIIKG